MKVSCSPIASTVVALSWHAQMRKCPGFWPYNQLAIEKHIYKNIRELGFEPARQQQNILGLTMNRESSDQLQKYLADLGIQFQTIEHPAVYTVEESQKLRGSISGVHTKNLFLRDDKKNYFLLVAREDASVNVKALGKSIGAKGRLSFGSPDSLKDLLGITPGSVSALAAINDRDRKVTIIFDQKLVAATTINCHPLINTRTTSLSWDSLLSFLASTGHSPLSVSLEAEKNEA
jgi:Ala-tRNA(Pro) deacylase